MAIISADAPGLHIWPGASAGQGPSSSSPKQWILDGCVTIYNSVSATLPLTNPREKKDREHSNIKSKSVSALTGSVPRKMAKAQQNSSGIEPKLTNSLLLTLTTKPLVHISYLKKMVYLSLYFATCN